MNYIPFTQYLRPDGVQKQVSAPMPDGLNDKVDAILKAGWRFEVEVLTTGQVSQTVSNGFEDVSISLSANDASVEGATRALVLDAYGKLHSGVQP